MARTFPRNQPLPDWQSPRPELTPVPYPYVASAAQAVASASQPPSATPPDPWAPFRPRQRPAPRVQQAPPAPAHMELEPDPVPYRHEHAPASPPDIRHPGPWTRTPATQPQLTQAPQPHPQPPAVAPAPFTAPYPGPIPERPRRAALPSGYQPPDYPITPVRLPDGTTLHIHSGDLADPRYVNVRNLNPDGTPVKGRAGLLPRNWVAAIHGLAEPAADRSTTYTPGTGTVRRLDQPTSPRNDDLAAPLNAQASPADANPTQAAVLAPNSTPRAESLTTAPPAQGEPLTTPSPRTPDSPGTLVAAYQQHLQRLIKAKAFTGLPPAQRKEQLERTILRTLPQQSGLMDPISWSQITAVTEAARGEVAAMETATESRQKYIELGDPDDTGKWLSGSVPDSLRSLGRSAIAGVADLSVTNPDHTQPFWRTPGVNLAHGTASQLLKIADSTNVYGSQIKGDQKGFDQVFERFATQLKNGDFPLHDQKQLHAWLAQTSDELSRQQAHWYKSVQGPSWNPAYAVTNGLLSPRNAALVTAWMRTRDPETLVQLKKNLLLSPARAALEQNEDQRLAQDNLTQWLRRSTGQDYTQAVKDSPLALATMLGIGSLAAQAGRAGTTSAALSKGLQGVATGVVGGNLQLAIDDPHATWQQHKQASLEMIATGLGLTGVGFAAGRTSGTPHSSNPQSNVKGWTRSTDGNPVPKRIFSQVENIDKIANEGRLWGMTEGSVYGMDIPNAHWLRSMRGRKVTDVGNIVFEGEAAELFQRHPMDGPYGTMKRALGQYKAGFGDLVWDSADTVRDGNTLIVRKARLDPNHKGQTTVRAASRLRGRKVMEKIGLAGAAGTAGLYWYGSRPSSHPPLKPEDLRNNRSSNPVPPWRVNPEK